MRINHCFLVLSHVLSHQGSVIHEIDFECNYMDRGEAPSLHSHCHGMNNE